jgi:hypothetical protein
MARKRITLIIVWALSLIIVGALAHAQTLVQRGTTPTIISGSNLGFLVERQEADRVTGKLMVRINGLWVIAEPSPGAKALTLK